MIRLARNVKHHGQSLTALTEAASRLLMLYMQKPIKRSRPMQPEVQENTLGTYTKKYTETIPESGSSHQVLETKRECEPEVGSIPSVIGKLKIHAAFGEILVRHIL